MDGPPRGRSIVRVVEEPHALVYSRRIQFAPMDEQVRGDGERQCNSKSNQDKKDDWGEGLPRVALADDTIL